MRVFFTASFYGKDKYQKYYDMVLRAIEKSEVEVISPELGNYQLLLDLGKKEKLKDKNLIHYEAIKRGIQVADAVIIENSNEDFQLGHEATLAIQNKKPVLCLSIHEDFSKKINNRYFHGGKYNKFNVAELVGNFINGIRKELLSERFNFFLSQRQLSYLEQVSEENDLNMSEYLRKLIDEDIVLRNNRT